MWACFLAPTVKEGEGKKEREEGFALAQILRPSLEGEEEEGGRGGGAQYRKSIGGHASQPLPDARVLLSWELDNGL